MRVGLPILGVAIACITLLGGCMTVKSDAPQPPMPVTSIEQEEIQRDTERDMVILFQSLVQLDKQTGLAISAKQSVDMLPVVKRNSTEGELSLADQQRIVAVLTTEQKQFVAEYRERMMNRLRAMKEKKEPDGLSPEERERMVREFQNKRRLEHEAHNPEMANKDSDAPDSSRDMIARPDQQRANNVEERLIRLLERKISPNKE